MPTLFTFLAILIAIGFLGLLILLARAGQPASTNGASFTLRHSIVLRMFSLGALFSGTAIFSVWGAIAPPQDDTLTWAFATGAMLLAILGFALLWESYRWRLTVSPAVLECRSPWRPPRVVTWNEVVRVSYSQANGWYVVQFAEGSFRVPAIVPGVKQFVAECRLRIPDRCTGFA